MTVARVTQLGTQGAVQNDPNVRVTGEFLGAVIQADPNLRVTQGGVQLVATGQPGARLSSMFLQAIVKTKPERVPGRARPYQTSTTATKGIQGDPHWRSVMFLLNGEHGFKDASRFHAVGVGDRRYGPLISSETPKWGKSLWCANGATYGLIYPNVDPKRWYLGKKPFTIECWLRAPLSSATRGIIGTYGTGGNRGWALLLINNVITFYGSRDNTGADLALTGTTIAANTWTHICVERGRSGRVRMYVNGVMVSWVDFPDQIRMSNSPLCVMSYDTDNLDSNGFVGWLDDIRITKAARYDTNEGFEVPVAPYPYPAFDAPPADQDEYWDLVTCLVNANQNPVVDLKRAAALTIGRTTEWNEGTSGQYRLSGSGSIAHVDNQWDLGGRTEPFTFEMDAGMNSSSNPSPRFVYVANSWGFYVSRGGMGLQRWTGTGWSTIASWGGLLGWWWPHNLQTICMTRDETNTWRIWRMGRLVAKLLAPDIPAAPGTNLSLYVADDAVMDNLRMTWGVARYASDSWIEDDRHAMPYPLGGPPYVPPALPDPVYPFDLGFPDENDGFDSIAWGYSTGAVPSIVNRYQSAVPWTGEEDDFFRWNAGASTRVWNHATLPIPQQFWADVDAGKLFAEATGFGASSARQNDFGMIVMSARSITGAALRYGTTNVVNDKVMTAMQGLMPVPPGTRSIRCGFLAYRSGSNADFAYRKVAVRLLNETEDQRVYLARPTYSANGSEPDLTEWTDAKGGTILMATADWNLRNPVTTNKTMDLRCVEELPSSLVTEIDAGQAAFRFEAFIPLNSADTNDLGRMYVEFLDDGDQRVGRRKWDSATPYIPATLQRTDLAAPIPAGARKVVVGIFGSKDYGEGGTSNCSFQPSFYNACCYLPAPKDMPEPAPEPPVLMEDEHWDKVAFLLSSRNGALENLANTKAKTLAAAGTVAVANVASPFGTTAFRSNLAAAANNSDYVNVEMFGRAYGPKMTFEGWFMKTGHSSRAWTCLHSQFSNGADHASNPMRLSNLGSVPVYADYQLAWGEWYHIALCRDDTGRSTLFVNGKKQAISGPANATLWSNVFRLFYCTNGNDQASWVGYADEIRITHDVERYTEDFTPPEQRWPVGPSDLPEQPHDAYVEAAWGVPDLAAIYSLRRTVPEYAGPLVTGLRVSDGAKKDFYPGDDDWLDVAEVESWAGGGDVIVYRWHDQSSKGSHAYSWLYTANAYPLLATAGVVEVRAGVPFVRFGGSNLNTKTWLLMPFNVFKSPFTLVYTGQRSRSTGNGTWGALFSGALSSNGLGVGYAAGLTPSLMCNGSSDSTGGTTHPLDATIINAWKASAAYAGGTYSVTPYVSKGESTVRSLNFSTRTLTDDFTYLGGTANDAAAYVGLISEVVVALSALNDTNRQAIENHMVLANYGSQEAEYPFTLSLLNGGFEIGDTTGWSMIYGQNVSVGNSGDDVPARTGSKYGVGAASHAANQWGQFVTIPALLWDDIDAGLIEASGSVWMQGWSGDSDRGRIQLEALDQTMKLLSDAACCQMVDPTGWTEQPYSMLLPPGTRFLRLGAACYRASGTQASIYFDDFSDITLTKKDTPHTTLFLAMGNSLDNWTVDEGSVSIDTTGQMRWGWDHFYGTNSEAAMSRVEPVPSELIGSVDAGDAVLRVRFYMMNYPSQSDWGRFSVQFLDTSDTDLGSSLQTAATAQSYSDLGEAFVWDQAVPVGTRKIRFVNEFRGGTSSTQRDCGAQRISAFLDVEA